jgi:hypothetical protein
MAANAAAMRVVRAMVVCDFFWLMIHLFTM